MVLFYDFKKGIVNVFETFGKWGVGRGGDDAKINGFCAVFCDFDDAKAANSSSWVNSEYSHSTIVARLWLIFGEIERRMGVW